MNHSTPIHTFWSIIGMTIAALVLTRCLEISGQKAMPIFVVFMLLGVPLGEFLERRSKRSKAR